MNIEERMDVGTQRPMCRPHFDNIGTYAGCWMCPPGISSSVNTAFLCIEHTDELRSS